MLNFVTVIAIIIVTAIISFPNFQRFINILYYF